MHDKQHFAVLDGMRGVAALIVLVFHVVQGRRSEFPEAALAVDFFFILSGFVIAYAYEAKLENGMSFRTFAEIRLIRLYPLIFFGVSFGVAVSVIHLKVLGDISTYQLILGAILGYLLLPCYIYPQWSTVYPMNLPSWSLFFELTANFAYALGLRYLSTSRLIFLTILGAMILAIIAFFTGDVQSTGAFKTGFWLGFGRVLFPFAAGILLFRFRSPVRYAPWLGCVLPIFLAVLLLSPVGQSPVLDLLYIIVLFPSIVRLGASINVGPKLTNVFLAAGKMSYPLYITHHPLLRVFYRLEEHIHVSEPLFLVIETLACIVFAYCALRFYDEPLRAMLNSLSRRSLVREAVPRLSGMRLPLGYYPLPLRRTSRQVESKITPPTPS